MATKTQTIMTVKNFDINNLKFQEPTKNKLGGKVVYMNYKDSRLNLQTPWMKLPFGLSVYEDQSKGISKKYSVDLSFQNMDNDPKIKEFYDKCQEFDNHLLDVAVQNSKEWFGKKMKKEVLEELMRPLTKQPKDDKYSPTFKIKINNIDRVDCYDIDKNRMSIMDLAKGSKGKVIMECSSVWFVGNNFGVSFSLVQLMVDPPEQIAGFAFKDDSDDEEESEEEEEEVEEED